MVEPASQLNPDDEDSRYLSAEEKAARRWGLGGSKPDANEPEVNDHGEPTSARKKADKKWGMEPEELKDNEENPAQTETGGEQSASGVTDQVGKGYNPEKKKKPGAARKVAGKLSGISTIQKFAGGGVVGLAIAAIMGVFIIFTPILKLESFLSSINQRVFGVATNAVQSRIQTLFNNYMGTQIFGMQSCRQVRSIDCKVDYNSNTSLSGKVKNLYAAWQDQKVEQKLFDDMNLQIKLEPNPSGGFRYDLRDPLGHSVTLKDEGSLISLEKDTTNTLGPRQLGKSLNQYIKQETKWYDVVQRVHVRRTLTRKYGIQFYCFFLCKTLDSVTSKVANAKANLELKLVERIVYPFSEKYGIVLDCLINSGNCNLDKIRQAGNVNKLTDDEAQKIIDRVTKKEGTKAGQTVLGDETSGETITFTQFLVQELAARVFNTEAPQGALDAIPIAGQIYMAVTIVDKLDSIKTFLNDKRLSELAATITSTQYVQFYSAMRSVDDEMKNHMLPLDDVGAVMDSFDNADQSLVYKQYNTPGGVTEADRNNSNYTCADGKPIPAGQLVCNEKKVTRTFLIQDIVNSEAATGVANVLDSYDHCIGHTILGHCPQGSPKTYIHKAISIISSVSGFITNLPVQLAFAAAKHVPGVSNFYNLVQKQIGNVVQYFFNWVFPLPIKPDSSGRDKYDGLEAGAETTASDYAEGGSDSQGQYGLGGEVLTPQQTAAVTQQYDDQSNYDYQHSTLYARLTDLSRPNSFASIIAQSVPSSLNQAVASFASALGNVFNGKLFSSFGNMLLIHTGQAHAEAPVLDPFGIPTYGYPVDDPGLTMPPDQMTPQFCAQAFQARENSKYIDQNSGLTEYSKTDPCMLNDTAIDAAGSIFTND